MGILSDSFKLLSLKLKNKVAEAQADLASNRLAENMFGYFSNNSNIYFDTEKQSNNYVTGNTNNIILSWDKNAKSVGLEIARNVSRELAQFNSHARNIVNQITNYTVGKGFFIKFKNKSKQAQWEKDEVRLKWAKRRREILRRIVRDGECFVRKFGSKTQPDLRFVEPENIPGLLTGGERGYKDSGIIFRKDDAETPEYYIIDGKRVPADEIFHFKPPFADLNELRGWPMLYDASPIIRAYENWVKDRALLNRFRSAIMMLRKHKHSNTQAINSFKDKVKSGDFTRGLDGKQVSYQYFPPGSIIDADGGIEYEFMNPNIGAQDVVDDGRALRLLIACFFSFPEYMVTCDASNSNFASIAVAEAPGIKAMESWQEFYSAELQSFLTWFYEEINEVRIVFPGVIVKNELEEAKSRMLRYRNGEISLRTWRELDGMDSEEEQERIDSEEIPEIITIGGLNSSDIETPTDIPSSKTKDVNRNGDSPSK